MICALCKEKEANKTNTHFLTDGIIRNCLNQDGSAEREKGFYFNLSNENPFVEFNFQRDTSIEKIEQTLEREATENEIEKAKKNPFSVDNVFCSVCESNFEKIESKFITELLPKFRETDLSKTNEINIENVILIRLFFYLQIWRTAICDTTFKLSEKVIESLRQIILNYESIEKTTITQFPLSITYLETRGDKKEYTSNYVCYTNDSNPNIIFMNDFVIQFYENLNEFAFFDFYGLNAENSYVYFCNVDKNQFEFAVNVFHNAKRKQFLKDFITANKIEQTIDLYIAGFVNLWLGVFGTNPTPQTIEEYQNVLTNNNTDILKYTKENIVNITNHFIQNKFKS